MSYQDILFEADGDIRWIKINREAKGNAFRLQTVREMIDALEQSRRDLECRSVVITGVGERFFCLGGDHDGAHSDDDPRHYRHTFPVVDLYDLIDKLYGEHSYKPFAGGLGRYKTTSAHGPFVHVDVRGFRARWGD